MGHSFIKKTKEKARHFFGYMLHVTCSKKTGFTLMEVLVYVGLLTLLMGLMLQFVLGMLDANLRGEARELVVSSTVQAIDTIDSEVRRARMIYTPTSVFSAHPGQLSLVTTRSVPTGESETYVDFFLSDDDRLCIRRESQATQCITSPKTQITDLRFVRLTPTAGPESIQTILTLEYESDRAELRLPYTLQSTSNFRRY